MVAVSPPPHPSIGAEGQSERVIVPSARDMAFGQVVWVAFRHRGVEGFPNSAWHLQIPFQIQRVSVSAGLRGRSHNGSPRGSFTTLSQTENGQLLMLLGSVPGIQRPESNGNALVDVAPVEAFSGSSGCMPDSCKPSGDPAGRHRNVENLGGASRLVQRFLMFRASIQTCASVACAWVISIALVVAQARTRLREFLGMGMKRPCWGRGLATS